MDRSRTTASVTPSGEVHAWERGHNETVCGLSLSTSRLTRFPHVGWADVQPESGRHAEEVQDGLPPVPGGMGARRDERGWTRTNPRPDRPGSAPP